MTKTVSMLRCVDLPIEEVEQDVLTYIGKGNKSLKEITENVGFSSNAGAHRVLYDLVKEGIIERTVIGEGRGSTSFYRRIEND
jgi:uncharacterized membrane protein